MHKSIKTGQKVGGKGMKVVEIIKEMFGGYTKTQQMQITILQKAYLERLARIKPLSQNSSTTSENSSERQQEELPILFRMRDEKHPVIESDPHFAIQVIGSELTKNFRSGQLQRFAAEMTNRLCHYQNDRLERLIGTTEPYDPTNLFCEVEKEWYEQLAGKAIDEAVAVEVEAHIKYLRTLLKNDILFVDHFEIFNKSTKRQLFVDLLTILEKNVRPEIQLALSSQSAREHFSNLRNDVDNVITNLLPFIFYIFRDTNTLPKSFLISEMIEPKLHEYKINQSTLTFQLLQALLQSERYSNSYSSVKKLNANKLLPNENVIGVFAHALIEKWQKDNNIKDISLDHWYEYPHSGILKEFQQPAVMTLFLDLHEIILRLCDFKMICETAHGLAGKGGNLLVYGYMASYLKAVISEFQELLSCLQQSVDKLYFAGREYEDKLFSTNQEKDFSNWRCCFNNAANHYEAMESALAGSRQKSDYIMTKISTITYQEQFNSIKEEMHRLNHLVDRFVADKTRLKNISLPKLQYEKPVELNLISNMPKKIPAPQLLPGSTPPVMEYQYFISEDASQSLHFFEIEVPHDEDSAFYALGITRKEIIFKLIEKADDPIFREILAPVIKFAIVNQHLPKIVGEILAQQSDYKKIYSAYIDTCQIIADFCDKRIRSLVPPACNKLNFRLLLQWTAQPTNRDAYRKYQGEIEKYCKLLDEHEKKFEPFCLQSSVYKAFLQGYFLNENHRLAYVTKQTGYLFNAIGKLFGWGIAIWQLQTDKTIKLLHVYPDNQTLSQAGTRHILSMETSDKGIYNKLINKQHISTELKQIKMQSPFVHQLLLQTNSLYKLDAELILKCAQDLINDKAYYDAIPYLKMLIKQDLPPLKSLQLYAKCLANLHKREKALQVYDKILANYPLSEKEHEDTLKQYAVTLERLGRVDEAIKVYEQLLKIKSNPSIIAERAVLMFDKGKQKEALEEFEHALALAPHDGWILFKRGKKFYESGAFYEAKSDLEKSYQLLRDERILSLLNQVDKQLGVSTNKKF